MRVPIEGTKTIAKENNDVDIDILLEFKRLNEEYQRLVEPIKGATKGGANYNISHPFEHKNISDRILYLVLSQRCFDR